MPLVPTNISLVGQILDEDVFTTNGMLLLGKGTILRSVNIYALLTRGIQYVRIAPPVIGQEQHSIDMQLHRIDDKEISENYVTAIGNTKQLFEQITEDYLPPVSEFTEAFFPLADRVLQQSGIFRNIYALEGAEQYTYRHSINVGMLSSLIAKLLNKSKEEIYLIGQAGFLHDIGKMLIPKELLLKPTKLTDSEFEIMQQHTIHGYHLISRMEDCPEIVADCALLHHERLDGSGYPRKYTEELIPLACQIVAVADVFDAMCTDRIYRTRSSPFEAAKYLWNAAYEGKLNAKIVTKFVHYIAQLYVGSMAVMNTGDEAEVVLINQDEPLRPLVRVKEEYVDLRLHRTMTIEKMILPISIQ